MSGTALLIASRRARHPAQTARHDAPNYIYMEDWKNKLSSLYAGLPRTDDAPQAQAEPAPAPPARRQTLRVELDKRGGKPATLITEWAGTDDELRSLAKTLKTRLGTGGSARGGEILVQGDVRVKVASLLESMGYKVRKINF